MKLFLIPCPLAEETQAHIPAIIPATVAQLDTFFVENERTARRFIASMGHPKPITELTFYTVDKDTKVGEVKQFFMHAGNRDMGVLSEAGCPGIADPGSVVVSHAHSRSMEVVPLTGPSSILLALMASGMSGQKFAFHGYLPVEKQERISAIRKLERDANQFKQTQIFIETPYRNNQMMQSLVETCQPNTYLGVAADLTSPEQFVKSQKVSFWSKNLPDLHKKPCVFMIGPDASL
jgi:16S rRNA (cytidine1402-2'-O)-methyltransferase